MLSDGRGEAAKVLVPFEDIALGMPGLEWCWKLSDCTVSTVTLCDTVPSGKRLHNHGKSPFSMGKSTISTGPFSIANC